MDFTTLNGRNATTGKAFQIIVPTRTVHAKLRAQLQRDDPRAAMMTPGQAANRTADNPLMQRTFLVDPDERIAKYDKPYAVFDRQEGQMPRLIVASGTMSREQLAEWADEEAHYSRGMAAEIFPNGGRRDLVAETNVAIEKLRDSLAGRKRYAFGKRGGLAGEWV